MKRQTITGWQNCGAHIAANIRRRPAHTLLAVLGLLALLLSGIAGSPARAQGEASLAKHLVRFPPNANDTKYPAIQTDGAQVWLSSPSNRYEAAIWQAGVADAAFGQPMVVGIAGGQPDYSPVSITRTDDGSLYAAFIDQDSKQFLMRRYAAGEWGPARSVIPPTGNFLANLTMGSVGNTVFVFWRSPDDPFAVRATSDGGVSWSPLQYVHPEHVGIGSLSFAAGDDGSAHVAYATAIDDTLQIVFASWNGSNFVNHTVISPPGRHAADPGVVMQANGVPLAAWREVGGSVYMAERLPDQGWVVQQLAAVEGHGPTALTRDAVGNVAAYWLSDYSGAIKLYAAVKPLGGSWIGPFNGDNDGYFLANTRADGLLHTVTEAFGGDTLTLRYVQFAATGLPNPNPRRLVTARPVLEHGAAVTTKDSLALEFADASDPIARYRSSWNAATLEQAAWTPFAETMSVAVPPEALAAAQDHCVSLNLAAQVQTKYGQNQATPSADSILLDRGSQTRARLTNPATGEADATNSLTTTLHINTQAECSQVTRLTVSLQASGLRQTTEPMPAPLTLGPFAPGRVHTVPFVLPDIEDTYTATIQITDEHGHTVTRSCVHDLDASGPTIVQTGTLSIEPNPHVSVHPLLHISDTMLRDWFMELDMHHSEERIWGLLIKARRQGDDPTPANSTGWTVPFNAEDVIHDVDEQTEVISGTFEIPLEQLFTSKDLTNGTYVIEVHALDDAGNASPLLAELDFELDEISYPPALLPLVLTP